MIITLTGFMGCGKSSVGRKLSSLLSCSWTDLDRMIEEKEGRTVAEIFRTEGEPAFRRKETEALQEAISRRIRIISLGGGTPTIPECRELIREKTVCIYLKATPETLVSHLEHSYMKRPHLADIPNDDMCQWKSAMTGRVRSLLEEREKIYEETARFTVCIDGKQTHDIIADIVELLNAELS